MSKDILRPTQTSTCFGKFETGQAYAERDCNSCSLEAFCETAPKQPPKQPPIAAKTAADILIEMGNTYRERNAVYGDNYKMVAKLVAVLFPNGVPPELVVSDQWHLFELKLVKLSRFAISNLTHIDSIHDDAVYAAMIEAIIRQQQEQS